MKKIFTLATFIIGSALLAQESETENVQKKPEKLRAISLNITGSTPTQIGVSYERMAVFSDKHSLVAHISSGGIILSLGDEEVAGSGFVGEIGIREYFKPNKFRGFYAATYLSYGNIKFDEPTNWDRNFQGTYSYVSFFSPELGYKFMLGNFAIDPFIGAMWKIQIKAKGDMDNNAVDNWAPRIGFKIGYTF